MSRPTRYLRNLFILISASLILLAACASANAPQASEAESFAGGMAPAAPREMDMGESFAADRIGNSVPADTPRLVIKNADISLVVSDPPAVMDTIYQLAEEFDGYVVSANSYQSRLESGLEVPRASITIRVEAERLEEALERIEAQSDREPLSKNINSQDVTGEYTDLASRLRNLEETEIQLREIMDDALRTEDVLAVYQDLTEVREQIEVIKGQMQYYEQSAALSSISVELIANEAVQPLTIGGWQPVGVAKDAIQALINALKFLANAAIWIMLFMLPVLAVLYVLFILPFSLIWRALRKRRARVKANQPAQTPPAPPATPQKPA